jgi:hypothetical protein
VKTFFQIRVLVVTRSLLKRDWMKTGNSRSTRKSSRYSRGGVRTRSFERVATRRSTQAVIFTFREIEFLSKNLSLMRSVSTQLSGIFLKKFVKNEEGIVPLVAPEQGASLPWGKDALCSASNAVANM